MTDWDYWMCDGLCDGCVKEDECHGIHREDIIAIIQEAVDKETAQKLLIGVAALEGERLGVTAGEIGKAVNGITASTVRGRKRVVKAYGKIDEDNPHWLGNARAIQILANSPGVMYTHLRTALELPTAEEARAAIDAIPDDGDIMTDEQFRRTIGLRTKTHQEWTPNTAVVRLGQLAGHAEEIATRIIKGYWPVPPETSAQAQTLAQRIITDTRALEDILDKILPAEQERV